MYAGLVLAVSTSVFQTEGVGSNPISCSKCQSTIAQSFYDLGIKVRHSADSESWLSYLLLYAPTGDRSGTLAVCIAPALKIERPSKRLFRGLIQGGRLIGKPTVSKIVTLGSSPSRPAVIIHNASTRYHWFRQKVVASLFNSPAKNFIYNRKVRLGG